MAVSRCQESKEPSTSGWPFCGSFLCKSASELPSPPSARGIRPPTAMLGADHQSYHDRCLCMLKGVCAFAERLAAFGVHCLLAWPFGDAAAWGTLEPQRHCFAPFVH